ncbi:MAG: cytochrome c oxidase subunit II [Candidatus Caldarchaeum sp.]|uniref:cytochrome-c oxidase n=1 Tax=Caldiarchaeum subterraneum TaxID=311458 RepID=A0A7C5QF69_CALS0
MANPYELSPISQTWQSLFDLYLTIGTVTGAVVIGLMVYALFKYRSRREVPEPADAIKPGRLPAERGTIGAALILTVIVAGILFVVSFGTMQASEFFEKAPTGPGSTSGSVLFVGMWGVLCGQAPPQLVAALPKDGSVMVVKVEGFQWGWKFIYPNGRETVNEAVIPAGKIVVFEITSSDVFHKFHMPQFKTGVDAIPGKVNNLWMTSQLLGEYLVQCYELCGGGHAYMKAKISVVSEQAFKSWYGSGV